MSINNAIQFIRRITDDKDFRKGCYQCNNKRELHQMLEDSGVGFIPEEFPIAFDMVHLRCQTVEEADLIKQAEIIYSIFPQG